MAEPKRKYFLAICVILLITVAALAKDEVRRCNQCGMDLTKYPHSIYTIQWKDGTTSQTCGVQCGLTQQLKKKDLFKSAYATDLITNQRVPAEEGFYVFKSSVTTDMGPGFIAFKQRVHAEKFQKGFGGQLLSYPEALKKWAQIKQLKPQ